MEVVVSPKFLSDREVLLDQKLSTPDDLFALIGRTLGRGDTWQSKVICEGLATRHRRATVALGHGIAVPHAAVAGLTRPRALYVRSQTPIHMGAPDRKGVTDALALVVPKPGFDDDFRALMRLKDAVLAAPFVDQLRKAVTPQAVFHLLTGLSD